MINNFESYLRNIEPKEINKKKASTFSKQNKHRVFRSRVLCKLKTFLLNVMPFFFYFYTCFIQLLIHWTATTNK